MSKRWRCFVAAAVVFGSLGTSMELRGGETPPTSETAAASTSEPSDQGVSEPRWLTDYSAAMQQAREEQKMLFIHFRDEKPSAAHQRFESQTLADPGVRTRLTKYVCLRLPMSAPVNDSEGSPRLISHRSFHYMYGRSGVAIIDMANTDAPYYGHVVSCFPFDRPVYYCDHYEGVSSMRTILDLPAGTITQRTMVYAVRMHPERPASTVGEPNPVLQQAASQHSRYQARIRLLGHHGWNSRAQRILGLLRGGRGPSEVCAQSWPGPGLVAACLDCVHSWRQSSGHWSAVRARQPAFGYDIRRGSNGIWYATGIFGG
jgi:hypothetical protein